MAAALARPGMRGSQLVGTLEVVPEIEVESMARYFLFFIFFLDTLVHILFISRQILGDHASRSIHVRSTLF